MGYSHPLFEEKKSIKEKPTVSTPLEIMTIWQHVAQEFVWYEHVHISVKEIVLS